MRVLYVYNQPRGMGGAIASAVETVRAAARLGLEVKVFARDSGDLPPNIIGRLRAGISALYAPESLRDFIATLEDFQPALVHIYELFPLISPWILPQCSQRNIPVVMNCDDYHLTCPIRNHFRRGHVCTECLNGREYRAVLHNCRGNLPESAINAGFNAVIDRAGLFRKHVSHYIALSEFNRQWLVQQAGIPPDRISLVPPLFPLAESAADPAKGEYVSYAGRFVPEKGIDTFLEAAQLGHVPCRLSRNEHFLTSIPLPAEVEVVVTSSAEELRAFYRTSRVIVVPSIWFETFGIVPAEAMSHGIPVILSRIGALTGLVEEGVDGLYFEPGDARDLASKISLLWENPELCRRMGRAAREKALRLWRQDQFCSRLLSVYDKVAATHHAPR